MNAFEYRRALRLAIAAHLRGDRAAELIQRGRIDRATVTMPARPARRENAA